MAAVHAAFKTAFYPLVRRMHLMPEIFTMNDLQVLYETLLGEKLLRTSFQRKMLNLEILEHIDKKFTGAANKAPYLYKFVRK